MRLARRAANLKDVAEPLGCDQADFRRRALDDEVGNKGRRVDKTFNGYLVGPRLLENVLEPRQNARGEVARRARHLESPQAAMIEQDDVGMRSKSEEHTSELQSLMRLSYAVFCLK